MPVTFLPKGQSAGQPTVAIPSFTAAASSVHLAFTCGIRAAGASNQLVTDDMGGSWTLLFAPTVFGGPGKHGCWFGEGLSGTGVISCAFNGQNQDSAGILVYEITGHDPALWDAGDNNDNNTGASTDTERTTTLSFIGPTLATIHSVALNGGAGGGYTVESPSTLDDQVAEGNLRFAGAHFLGQDTTPRHFWTTARACSIIAVEILASGGVGAVITRRRRS